VVASGSATRSCTGRAHDAIVNTTPSADRIEKSLAVMVDLRIRFE
jgi:hypothetical protein